MSKNDKLINSLRKIASRNRSENIAKAAERDTAQIYAVLAISLYKLLDIPDEDKRVDAIEQVFAESQKIWLECSENDIDVNELCEKETGIDVRYTKGEQNAVS